MCDARGRITDSAPGMPSATVRLIAGVASSCSPVTTSVGTSISPSRSTTLHSRSVPVTWNSLGPFHRSVDDPVPLDEVERALHAVGPRVDTADVPPVEDHRGLAVLGVVSRPRCLAPVEHRLHLSRQLRPQAPGLLDPLRNAGRRAREHEALEARRLRERVLHRQHAAPRVPEEVDTVEAERLADGADLVDEELDRPERQVVGEVGPPAAELVVEDRAAAGPGHPLERLEVVVRAARPAVQAKERQLAGFLAVADDAVPRPVAPEWDEALGHYPPGSTTCNVSPSTSTEPPSVRTRRTATAAPRSRRSSPRTTGAEAGVIGETSTRGPSTRTSTRSRPPCRNAHRMSAASARSTAGASTVTGSPSPSTCTSSGSSRAAAARTSSPSSTCVVVGS